MWWAALAGGIQQKYHGYAERAVIQANNRLSKQNAESKNLLRQASNAAEASKGNLARWVQSVNNQRRMDSAGEALEMNIVNARRQGDSALNAGFSQSLQAAEQAGQMVASAAAAGVSGDVVDMVNTSAALRDSIVRQEFSERIDLAASDTARRAGNIMSQMVGGLDSTLLLDNLDYNIDIATFTPWKSTAYNFVQGAFKGMGMGSGLPDEKDQDTYDAKKSHGTDFTGQAKFSFRDDKYMTLDAQAGGREWFDSGTGQTSNTGWNSMSAQFADNPGDYNNAWRDSGTELGGKSSMWSW